MHWVEGGVNSYLATGNVPKRHGTGGTVIVPYQTFDCADGMALCLAPGNDRLWARCASVLGQPDWATDPKFAKSAARVAYKSELLPLIAAAMKTRTRADWLEALEKAGVPCSPVNDIGELANAPQFAAAKIVQTLPVRAGEKEGPKVVGLPITFDRHRPAVATLGAQARRTHGGSARQALTGKRYVAHAMRLQYK